MWLPLILSTLPSQDPSARFHFGGYGEVHYNQQEGSGGEKLDLHRFVLYLGYDFADWIQLHSETEIEHALVEDGQGELAIEQLHVDFLLSPGLNLRVGRYLQPLGIVNQRHEPPSFHGVERPEVETYLLPSTWTGDGLGVFGQWCAEWKYQLYLGSSLDGSGLDPINGLRGSRQESQPGMDEPALSGRVDWQAASELRLGASFFRGGLNNGDGGVPPGIDATATVLGADAEWSVGSFDFRALYALDAIDDAEDVGPGIAEKMDGWYVEAAWHFLPDACKEGRLQEADAVAFVRYESLDTQRSVPGGVTPDPRGEREVVCLGLEFFPVSNLVFKLDYQLRDDARPADLPERFNLGLGWQF